MSFPIVRAKIFTDNTGVSREMPVLLTPNGPLLPLIEYCLSKNRSLSWINKLLRAVALFLDYLEANSDQPEQEWKQFRNFANALRLGTIDRETGHDPSGLFWRPFQGPDVDYYLVLLSEFFNWIGETQSGDDKQRKTEAGKFNPRSTGGSYDQRIDEKAYMYRKNKAFLGHLGKHWSDNTREQKLGHTGRLTRGERPIKISKGSEPQFPQDRFEELLFKGFRVNGQYDWRGMAITTLLHGAGFRESEPFHLYMADIQPHWEDSSMAFVAIHHPSQGVAPAQWRNQTGRAGTRAQYLGEQYALTPRTHMTNKKRAGWKHPALDAKNYMQAWWFPEAEYGRLFLEIWQKYLEQIHSIERNHPFAFINLDRGEIGGMYTISQYLAAHAAAVRRIGLEPSKASGTTPHGHRHAYGRRLARSDVHQVIIQRVMHHCSPDSQLVYTQPELHEAQAALKVSAQTLRDKHIAAVPDLSILRIK
ncbi:gamma-mobile-trio recombinase GmtY [Polaromonas sp. CG_23.6]|uniref:gamma-mobile-trio recombinase GmtY n=1 Tax=Polaromonas sp. CG_23.6 TaxID=2760709 RepID=UPI0024767027|nr:gamma-mobile-trio recombinase GmtY [Polaromonas sp. CG_23.6]MDH6182648.1 hypothetical protein [Polaromonas sp. CG_23.6]